MSVKRRRLADDDVGGLTRYQSCHDRNIGNADRVGIEAEERSGPKVFDPLDRTSFAAKRQTGDAGIFCSQALPQG